MLISFFRTVIIYLVTAASMRFMGKRQIGELQPTELCITILISAVASVPMQDPDLPLINGIIPILTLIAAEIIISYISLKLPSVRKLLSGRPITVIRRGVIDRNSLISLRMTIDDLLEDLRLKGIYDIRKVKLAQVETNGRISVLLKTSEEPPSAKELNVKVDEEEPFETVISDGVIIKSTLKKSGLNGEWIKKTLDGASIKKPADVLYMSRDRKGNVIIVKKEN